MSSDSRQSILTERQLNLCEYGGVFGVLLSLTCLIQHMIVTVDNWITRLMVPYYIFAIITFILMGLKKTYALILLIISAALSIVMQFIWTKHQSLSVIVMCLVFYHVIIIIALYVEQVPAKLKELKKAEREEEDQWAGKL